MRRLLSMIGGVAVLTFIAGAAVAGDVPNTDWNEGYPHAMNRTYPPRSIVPPRIRYGFSRPVYRLPNGVKGVATLDNALSHLCQRGAFVQKSDGFYWALTPDLRLGVAFSGGANLDDPQKKAQAGKVYFFHNQDSRCTVYVGDQAKLMPNYIGS